MADNETKEVKVKKKKPRISPIKTHTGHSLSPKEAIFIDKYIELGNKAEAVRQAGYKTKTPTQFANSLMKKEHIAEEVKYRLAELESESIANATEILQYLTGVMRGEIKDQFGLDAPLSERTKCAQELAKRQIDMANRANGNNEGGEIHIVLDW